MIIKKGGYTIVKTSTLIEKTDFINALTFYCFKYSVDISSISKKESIKILRTSIWWTGKNGWTGDGMSAVDALGDGGQAINDFNAIWPLVTEYVEKNFPDLKDLDHLS